MKRLNVLGVDTPHGFRTIELFEGDITAIGFSVDILVVSAFRGSYWPSTGTVLGALEEKYRISIAQHADRPALDLRDALSVWLSHDLGAAGPFARALCVDIVGASMPTGEALSNVFAALMLLAAKGIRTEVVALPLLGAGLQRLQPDTVATDLVEHARGHLRSSPNTAKIVFVEIDPGRAGLISDAMDRVLGRAKVNLPREQLVAALRSDIADRLLQVDSLFLPDCAHVRDEWLRTLQQPDVRSTELGLAARKLVELMLHRLEVPKLPLYKRIRVLEERETVAPWICAYMHVLRQLGNESSHENVAGRNRQPPVVAPADLTAGLFCIKLLLDFWIERASAAVR